uniref:Uncharacterized protein n=1 Tax=Arundo donax TaxID=35708 RepID=A0A0A9A0Z5_ARUDO
MSGGCDATTARDKQRRGAHDELKSCASRSMWLGKKKVRWASCSW